MNNILGYIKEDKALKALLNKEPGVSGLSDNAESLLLAAAFQKSKRNIIVVKPTLFAAQNLQQRISSLIEDKPLLFAVEESLQIEAIAASPELEAARIETLIELAKTSKPQLVITHTGGILRSLPAKKQFLGQMIELKKGMTIAREVLIKKLQENGYELVDRVERPLTYSYRGEVLDVNTIQENNPIRIEFFDDQIDSIRYFDLETQLTVKESAEITIAPASDLLFTQPQKEEIKNKAQEKLKIDLNKLDSDKQAILTETVRQDLEYIDNSVNEPYLYRYVSFLSQRSNLTDYLDRPLVIYADEKGFKEHYRYQAEENISYLQDLFGEGKALLKFDVSLDPVATIESEDTYDLTAFEDLKHPILTGIRPADFPELPLAKALEQIEDLSNENTVLLALNSAQVSQLVDILVEKKLPYEMIGKSFPEKPGIYVWLKDLPEGFRYPEKHLVILSAKELFKVKFRFGRYTDKFAKGQILNDYDDLAIGDYVVHNQHGIGKYLGIVTKEFNGIHHDYLNIAYSGDNVLLVPLEQFKLVRKFVGSEGITPKLSKLGSNEWKKTKEKLQEDVDRIAEKLLNLYLFREQDVGYAFSKDDEKEAKFASEFMYELTPDQSKAVQEIKEDMESNKPMDRLLCGDVGFGKTEVAIRCAFKAVKDHKQVALLCPTTILSRQHYLTFTSRFQGYPIKIALMNRFVEPSKQKQILEQLREGKINILIGTHRLLSGDIQFKDLGFLIIDEEQRFGVESKEKIKELRQGIDVLSLSATPIPRTLQMSLIGVRSLSQLDTAPNERMPVQTYVIEKNNGIIKEVISRELSRNGQVFYLFNDVMHIYEMANRIRKLVPDARVAVAHGKMAKDEMEDVMIRFTDNEYNVLVCTTIIENGIDIPNANTMIVDKADTFGLSQLYQIKGRVGRSNKIAYAYLMYNAKKQLSEVATKRLNSIKDFTQLGSGYKIAMRDLSIRGAGDLLGSRQAGFINTVGMDMYVSMLQEAIYNRKGIQMPKEEEVVPRTRIGVDGYIPQEFARKDYEKIHLYQRIEKADTTFQLDKLEKEVVDRYGHKPKAVELLFEKRRLDLLSDNPKIQTIRELNNYVEIVFTKEWCLNVDGVRFFETISKISLDIKMKYLKGSIVLSIPKKNDWLNIANKILEKVKKL